MKRGFLDFARILWSSCRLRPEDIIPQWRTDAITRTRCLIVMLHVIAFEPFPDSIAHCEMVSRIMCQIIKKVSDQEATHKGSKQVGDIQSNSQDQVHQPIHDQPHWHADDRRHDQAGLALRLVVMHAVEKINDALLPGIAGNKMEQKAVQHVL